MTEPIDDAGRFEQAVIATSGPEVARIALAVRRAVLDEFPGAVEWFDPGNGLLAIGSRRAMRDLLFSINPHRSHVNLQLADGVDLPDPDGLIEGTGKRIRHVKVRSVEDARGEPIRRIIAAQVARRPAAAS